MKQLVLCAVRVQADDDSTRYPEYRTFLPIDERPHAHYAGRRQCILVHRGHPMIGSDGDTRQDKRLSRRYAVDGGVLEVSWLDRTGVMRVTRSRALDISEDGIALELPQPVMPLLVRFESDRFNVKGKGSVRHCRRVGSKYVVGLKFTGNLHWRPPEGQVTKPIPLCDPAPRIRELLRAFLRKLPRPKD